ncbi:hypothetical protein PISL3812_03897 [Talaromyces islandicus]|uniref:Alcohol dehydrogenase-like C-terminal domain-containing protein n=1 Tax=Talaromyces islandicus TaxID=28573 RepID=A0A0U1LUI3_TALIS|nr:hypothetical protein PISL3812_03897 [Talaromyces islandicus]
MKEAIIFAGPKVIIQDVDFPALPSPNYLIIKVIVSGSNPKDWAIAERGDTIVDYRDGHNAVVAGLQNAIGTNEKLKYAFDAVSDKGSFQNIMQVMDHLEGRITVVLARKKYEGIPDTVDKTFTQVGRVHSSTYPGIKGEKAPVGPLGDQEFGLLMYKFFERGLAKDWFSGHPFEVVDGGLRGIEGALRNLKAGKASAVKYVFRIEETENGRKNHL